MNNGYDHDNDESTIRISWSSSKPASTFLDSSQTTSPTPWPFPSNLDPHQKSLDSYPIHQEEDASSLTSAIAFGHHPEHTDEDSRPTVPFSSPPSDAYVPMHVFTEFQTHLTNILYNMQDSRDKLEQQFQTAQLQHELDLQ